MKVLHLLLCVTGLFEIASSQGAGCTWPTEFLFSTWVESGSGEIVFKNTTFTGLPINDFLYQRREINNWSCFSTANWITDGYLVIQSSKPITVYAIDYTAYKCMHLIKASAASYKYYELAAEHQYIGYKRAFVSPAYAPVSISNVCSTSSGASGEEYTLLTREGFSISSNCTSSPMVSTSTIYPTSSSQNAEQSSSSSDSSPTSISSLAKQFTGTSFIIPTPTSSLTEQLTTTGYISRTSAFSLEKQFKSTSYISSTSASTLAEQFTSTSYMSPASASSLTEEFTSISYNSANPTSSVAKQLRITSYTSLTSTSSSAEKLITNIYISPVSASSLTKQFTSTSRISSRSASSLAEQFTSTSYISPTSASSLAEQFTSTSYISSTSTSSLAEQFTSTSYISPTSAYSSTEQVVSSSSQSDVQSSSLVQSSSAISFSINVYTASAPPVLSSSTVSTITETMSQHVSPSASVTYSKGTSTNGPGNSCDSVQHPTQNTGLKVIVLFVFLKASLL